MCTETTCNKLCAKCIHDCKQDKTCKIIACKDFQKEEND